MKNIICLIAVFAAVAGEATQYSKLGIITAAKQAGKWDTVKSFIAAAGLEDEWIAANYITDTHPAFIAATNAVVASGLATSAEIAAFLVASKDTALPDETLMQFYLREMQSSAGRERWNGKVVSTSFDTNALTKTTVYTNGYVHVEKFKSAQAMGLKDRLSAAERKAQAEARAKAAAEAKERARMERIAELQTNLAYQVEKTMQKNDWPEELARLYLLNELNKLIGPVVKSVEIEPQR
jgi:hypothetical protein